LYNILFEFGIPMKLVRLIKMCMTKTYSRFRVSNHLSDMFPLRNSLKRGEALSPLLFNFALDYAIRRVRVNQVGLKLNSTRHILVYADDVNIMGENLYTIKEKAESLIVTSKEIGLEVYADTTKYMAMSRDQNAGRSHNMKGENRSFERVEEFKYLGKTLTYQNSIQKEIKSTWKSGNACYHWVQNLLSSIKIKIYRTIILPIVLYGCETWSLTLREGRRLRLLRIGC